MILQIEELDPRGHNAPTTTVADEFSPCSEAPVMRYTQRFSNGARVDALVINKRSETLVVSLHGALMRNKYKLPRFEWLATLRETPFSSMYLSDPGLRLNPKLQLSWFTGWREADMHQLLASWVSTVATKIGAKRIIYIGSSGGGFAALQMSFYTSASYAVAFNPQTDISAYLVSGTKYSAQRQYLEAVWPDIFDAIQNQPQINSTWKKTIETRVSAVDLYKQQTHNRVLMIQNTNDFHLEQHCLPLIDSVRDTPNAENIYVKTYDGPTGHRPPSHDLFLTTLMDVHRAMHSNTFPLDAVKSSEFPTTIAKARQHEPSHD